MKNKITDIIIEVSPETSLTEKWEIVKDEEEEEDLDAELDEKEIILQGQRRIEDDDACIKETIIEVIE